MHTSSGLYGVRVESPWPLPYRSRTNRPLARITIVAGSNAEFSRLRRQIALDRNGSTKSTWFTYRGLPDGSDYVRWSGQFEFLVSRDGQRVTCRRLSGASDESFETYLLNQVLSFALIKQGVEPLHATSVVVDGVAVGFLGGTGYGKSTLAAAFLQSGVRLLTDDALVLKKEGNKYLAFPGISRIKLYPTVARIFLPNRASGTPVNRGTAKLILRLTEGQICAIPVRLKALYVIAPSSRAARRKKVTIRRLSPRQAFVKLLQNTFNRSVVHPRRLQQQFLQARDVATNVPVKLLSYPRSLSVLPTVRDTILSDLR